MSLWIDVQIPYEPNKKLAYAYNRAMENTTAEWVLFLDHDLFICNPHWYQMCLTAIEVLKGKDVGWITARCNRIACPPQRVKPPEDSDDIKYHIGIAKQLYQKFGNQLTKTDALLSGFFILTSKAAWWRAGGFKDVGKGISQIDNDYSRRIMEAGFEQYVMDGLYFYHLWKRLKKTNLYGW
jgi:glycosyltransferase involved in cell wall biosynthesis